jgi:hypothetical protein
MSNIQLLSPQDHGALRLRARTSPDPHFVQIIPSEFRLAAGCSPIVFTKHPESGAFYPGVLLGFKPEEGALQSIGERGGFDPMALQRDGFFVSGEQIAIDLDNPRFSQTEGDALFDDSQQPSETLRRIQQLLGELYAGLEATKGFVNALAELNVIEPLDVSLGFENGERLALTGLYTASLDKLNSLADADVLRLFRAGYLQLACFMAASLQHLRVLAHVRNQRLARA